LVLHLHGCESTRLTGNRSVTKSLVSPR
jgi:hypothetical protein